MWKRGYGFLTFHVHSQFFSVFLFTCTKLAGETKPRFLAWLQTQTNNLKSIVVSFWACKRVSLWILYETSTEAPGKDVTCCLNWISFHTCLDLHHRRQIVLRPRMFCRPEAHSTVASLSFSAWCQCSWQPLLGMNDNNGWMGAGAGTCGWCSSGKYKGNKAECC